MPDDVNVDPGNDGTTDVTAPVDTAKVADAAPVDDKVVEPSFRQFIPDEFKDKPYWESIKDDATLVKNYANAQEMIGKKGFIIPGADAKPEDWEPIHKAMGVPEKADGYVIEKPADLPADFPYSEERVGEFKALAHQLKLTPTQVKELVGWQMADGMKGYQAYHEQFTPVDGLGLVPKQWVEDHNKAVDTFKSELGDNYEQMMKKAEIAVQKFGGQELKDFMDKTGFGDSPALVRAWLKVAEATLTEDDLIKGAPAGGGSIDDRIKALNTDPAMLDERDPRHKAVVAERNKLIDEKYAAPIVK